MNVLRKRLKELVFSFWPPAAVVLIHAVFTAVFGHQRWLDPILHFFGGAAVLYFTAHLLQNIGFRNHKAMTPLLMVFSIIILWEIGEFLSDLFFHTHVQQGFIDTGSDIALGLAGAVLCFYFIRLKQKAPETQVI